MIRFRKELWTLTAQERQSRGRCFANMVLVDNRGAPIRSESARIHKFTYTLQRSEGSSQASLLNGHLGVNDAIALSIEPNRFLVARGFILELTPVRIVVGIDRKLERYSQPAVPSIFRIDKDELSGGMARIRDNLAQLMYAQGDTRRRALIVDLASPTFKEVKDVSTLSTVLNANQMQAVEKILGAENYALILGMPGTGKTMTVAEILRILVERGNSVLLASYTHSAVDSILLKLEQSNIDILRIGNSDKVSYNPIFFHLSILI